jgi:hypothetical protein
MSDSHSILQPFTVRVNDPESPLKEKTVEPEIGTEIEQRKAAGSHSIAIPIAKAIAIEPLGRVGTSSLHCPRHQHRKK